MGPAKLILGDWVDALDPAGEMAYEGLFTVLAVAILHLIITCGLKSDLARAGWNGLKNSVRGFGHGALVGLGMSGGMFLLTLLTGGGEFSLDNQPWTSYFARVLPVLIFCLVATLGEEWLFRGYPLTVLARATNPGWANLIMGVLFAAAHASSAGFNSLVFFNIVTGSLVVGAMRFTSGGIAAAWGFHFAWNSLQVVLGSNLTGLDMNVPVLHFTGKGADWLSGGALGPEGGVGATASTIVVIGLLVLYFRKRGESSLPLPLPGSK
jgi:membrane protease YdiL (CAAX protease family)